MIDTYYNLNTGSTIITSESVEVTFNIAPGHQITAPYSYNWETNVATSTGGNGITFYSALQQYGTDAAYNQDPNDHAYLSVFGGTTQLTGTAGPGGVEGPILNEGTGAHSSNDLPNITSGSKWIVTFSLSSDMNTVTETVKDEATGVVYNIGTVTGVNATYGLVNSGALIAENYSENWASFTPSLLATANNTDITWSNFTVNGQSQPMVFGTTQPGNSNVENEIQETGLNFYRVADGGVKANVLPLQVSNGQILGTGIGNILQMTANNHDLTGDGVQGVSIIDLAGQTTYVTAAEKAMFTTVQDSVGGGHLVVVDTASQAVAAGANTTSIVADTAGNIMANLDGLNALVAAGKITEISLSDTAGYHTDYISITAQQMVTDAKALSVLNGSYTVLLGGYDTDNALTHYVTEQDAPNVRGSGGLLEDSWHGLVANTNAVYGYENNSNSSGYTTMVLAGNESDYKVTFNTNGSVTVQHGTDAAVTGQHVNYLDFFNGQTESMVFIGNANQAIVDGLYAAILGRVPDTGGVEYYSNLLTQGYSLEQISNFFMNSPEFKSGFAAASLPRDNGGANDNALLTEFYQNILHRTPSAAELQFYDNDIQGKLPGVPAQSLALIAVDFVASPENQALLSNYIISNDHLTAPVTLTGIAPVYHS